MWFPDFCDNRIKMKKQNRGYSKAQILEQDCQVPIFILLPAQGSDLLFVCFESSFVN